MTGKTLNRIIDGLAITDRRGRLDQNISGITADSRMVEEGNLFVAVRGHNSDGHNFVEDALKRGASAVLAEEWSSETDKGSTKKADVVLVPNTKKAVAITAANYFGQPSEKLLLAGVTGTNGKTTVSFITESIMRAASRKVGIIGTLGYRYGDVLATGTHTTPDAISLQKTLSEMKEEGVTHVVMEVSSHALAQERVAGVHFKVAGFTNLSQDHLDYHKDLEEYFNAKSRLFSDVLRKSRARGRMAIVNVDDPKGEELLKIWGGKSLRVSVDANSDADVVALERKLSLTGSELTIKTPKGIWNLAYPLIGEHNVTNVLVGIGMALAMGFSRARIEKGLKQLEVIPGRMQRIGEDDNKYVFVDYAHTSDALSKVLESLRPLVSKRIIVVFGCGGDRDQEKRPLMGAAVAKGADVAIVTNDNPRNEKPEDIAEAIEKGLIENAWTASEEEKLENNTFVRELDRREAIRKAIDLSEEGDLVLIAGKGHENTQTFSDRVEYFDDAEESLCILQGLPPPAPKEDIPGIGARQPSEAPVELEADDIEGSDVDESEEDGTRRAGLHVTAEVELAAIESVEDIESESDDEKDEEEPPEDPSS